ncbi:MAG: carboxypeptidase regulatory-like domain-containing protein, partial [Bryobacteraceae bacterium]
MTDQSGAVIPGASVSVLNTKTQARANINVGPEGTYVFPSLQPGTYTVSAEAPGFRKAVIQNVVLNVSDTATQLIRMEVGQVTESVMVEANSVNVQTSEAQIGRSITLRDINVLPSLNRTPITLAVYSTPGVQIDAGDNSFSRINGQRQGSTNTPLDGIDVNDAVVPRLGLSLTANNMDSVGEFRVITSGAKAEYGRNAGGQVEMITRSGTNEWHGNAFDYLRNTVLNANNFFNNSSGVARPTLIQNIFGGSVSAPIIRNKTFIFGNYQGRRTTQTTVRNRTVLTPEAKTGLYRWRAPGSSAIQSFNIVAADPRNKGIDTGVAANLKLLPDPNNFDIGDTLNTAGFRFNNPSGSYEDQFTIKGDHHLTGTHRIWYRHSWQRNSSIDALNNADATYPGQVQGRQGGHRWGNALGSDWALTPSMVNTFRYGHQSANVAFQRDARPKGPALISNLFTNPIAAGFAQGRNSPVDEFTNHLSMVRGVHTYKAGINVRLTTQNGYNDAGIYPNVTFARLNNNIPP